jgi:ATP/maltotriose-dependent transcriptional regulator MalT
MVIEAAFAVFMDMKLKDVEALLREIAAKDPSEINAAVATEQLEECFAVLRRETGFKRIAPGEPVAMLPYELVQAKDAVETAMGALADGDVPAVLGHCRSALSYIQRALRH